MTTSAAHRDTAAIIPMVTWRAPIGEMAAAAQRKCATTPSGTPRVNDNRNKLPPQRNLLVIGLSPNVVCYETALKADKFVLVVHGDAQETCA